MKKIFEWKKTKLESVTKPTKNYWVSLIQPKEEELQEVSNLLKIKLTDLHKVLDKSEIPHMDQEENYSLVILHVPLKKEDTRKKYGVYPFGIFFLKQGILTLSSEETSFQDLIQKGIEETIDFQNSKTYPIYLIGKSIEIFLKYLNEIREEILQKEKKILKATNKDLEKMLTLQKSLLYFTTSLQGNRAILEKIENNSQLTSTELDFLKDVQIELKQALEMSNIYREILDNTMNTYGSIITNNMNDVMKFLTSITLVISIPTMISSFLGMNVFLGDFGKNPYSFLLVLFLSALISLLLIILLKKKNLL